MLPDSLEGWSADWEPRVKGKKVELSEVKEHDYAFLLQEMVSAFVEEANTSIITADANRPAEPDLAAYARIRVRAKAYKYNGDRIDQIDEKRQDIIHRIALDRPVGSLEEDLWHMEATTSYVVNLVRHKYRLELDLKFWTNHIQDQAKLA